MDGPYEAVFVDGTSDVEHVMHVRVPALGNQLFGDPDGVIWAPIEGAAPQAGDRALVAESDTGAWWVLVWQPADGWDPDGHPAPADE